MSDPDLSSRRDRARQAAQAVLDTVSAPERGGRLLAERYVGDVGWGWVYAWTTGAPAPPGPGPIVVVKETLEAFALHSAPDYETQLARYADRHGLGETLPLDWG